MLSKPLRLTHAATCRLRTALQLLAASEPAPVPAALLALPAAGPAAVQTRQYGKQLDEY
jgi:predicted secreted protein